MKNIKYILLTLIFLSITGSYAQSNMIITYNNAGNRIKQQSECATIDCPNLGVNVKTPCNDGNPRTYGDYIRQDCSCKGDSLTSKIIFTCQQDIKLRLDRGDMGAIATWATPSVFSTYRNNSIQNVTPIPRFRSIGRFGNSEFYISLNKKNWADANKDCLTHGGYLAIISSIEENKFVSSNLGLTAAAFIGIKASSTAAGVFKTVDGNKLLFENWETGYPKDSKTLRQECVSILGWAAGRWATLNHAAEFYYIMEKPINNDVTLVQTSGMPSGSLFPVGTTKISYLAIDALGNRDSCSFNVIVTPRPNACNEPYNVAYFQKATMSSSRFNTTAMNAVDGNTFGNLEGYPVALTQTEQNPWIEIDLGSVHNVDTIKIWNRSDCCGEMLNQYYILISETPFASKDLTRTIQQTGVKAFFQNTQAVYPTRINFSNQKGRYVRLQLKGEGFISLAEIEIVGCMIRNGQNNSPNSSASNPTLTLKANKQESNAFLYWTTNSQVLNDSFIVQRSTDGKNFKDIKGLPSNNIFSFYSIHDENPEDGTNYYRIFLKLNNGTSIVSNIESLDFSKDFSIYPNPASDYLNINQKLFLSKSVSLAIVNAFGQEVFHHPLHEVVSDLQTLDLYPLQLPDGLYKLVFYHRGRAFSRTFIVHK